MIDITTWKYNIGKGLSIYDVWMSNPSHVEDGSSGQVACNSYYFYEKDVEALKSLGVRSIIHLFT